MTAPLPDAAPTNWVDRHAPEGLKDWLKLGRFDRPIGIWLLLLPGWQGITLALARYRKTPDAHDVWLYAGFLIGACLMRAAGCAFNDVVDRKIDAQVARTASRPVASGRISVNGAWAYVVGCSLISLGVLLTLGPVAIALGVASLALVAAYPFMKRITWWPQAWLGMTFNWGALMGFAAASILVATWPVPMAATIRGVDVHPLLVLMLPAILLWLSGVFWTLGYDTIYALQDVEDDALIGVKSSARRLGANVRVGVGVFYALAVVLAALAGAMAGLGPWFWPGLGLFALHLAFQTVRVRREDGALALRLFKSNRDAGLILLFAIGLGALG
ncbi:MAG TPA: 4-hydroxybenzoate octaprenyltransferase [Brevundimonas sp.]|jgi:4-hydroxybenzoate polyprenyltransferase|uniref:4-hydroxybenzoate octaprenyltransferase n=1 Tax=Brevundimonas sp. TaxID=1871086 RepID=UPI002DE85FC7|nr:4-hydroxybenzoate octaprenyltransferase [Brevundimonas sp.]